MSLTDQLRECVAACFSGIWITSHENAEAILELRSRGRSSGYNKRTQS